MSHSLKERYNELNNSFDKTLVFHIGVESGFFSEYNNMIFAMLYCLKHKIKFVLYTADANFGKPNVGWTTFFEPFCPIVEHNNIHSRYNYRFDYRKISWKTCFYYLIRAKAPLTLTSKLRQTFIDPLVRPNKYKSRYKFDFYTYELWSPIQDDIRGRNQRFIIPELDIDCDTIDACAKLIKMTWCYNESTKIEIDNLKSKLQLSNPYVSLHIRGGDKFLESNVLPLKMYVDKMDLLCRNDAQRSVFVLTDDYRIIEQLVNLMPNSTVQTLCNINERGYYHQEFIKLSNDVQNSELVKLFASIDMICQSETFIGTIGSNPGMYIKIMMREKANGIDVTRFFNK